MIIFKLINLQPITVFLAKMKNARFVHLAHLFVMYAMRKEEISPIIVNVLMDFTIPLSLETPLLIIVFSVIQINVKLAFLPIHSVRLVKEQIE